MHFRRPRVGFLIQELLLWGVIVGFSVNMLWAPVLASASLADGQTSLVTKVKDSPALHGNSMNQRGSDSGEVFQPKLVGLYDQNGVLVGDSRVRFASTAFSACGCHRASLVLLGIRMQI